MTELGLRERKKVETRTRITRAAIALFDDRGFEAVTVAEIAEAADVSVATVFNYFRTKEDLIYDGMASFHDSLLAAIDERPAGTSVVAAFRAHTLQPRGVLAEPDSPLLDSLSRVARIVHDSPSLQARERLESDRIGEALRERLTPELGSGLAAWAVASALVGVQRGMSREVQRAAAEDRLSRRFADRLLAEASEALDLVPGAGAV
jgi:AcrR family transcriptional regulator